MYLLAYCKLNWKIPSLLRLIFGRSMIVPQLFLSYNPAADAPVTPRLYLSLSPSPSIALFGTAITVQLFYRAY